MSTTFKCPHCGAPLNYDGGQQFVIKCDHCGMSTAVPKELRPPQPKGSPNMGFITPEVTFQINELLAKNNKIEAIKVLRQATGLGLKESKDAVEAFSNGDVDTLNRVLIAIGSATGSSSTAGQTIQVDLSGAGKAVGTAASVGCVGTLMSIGVVLAVIGGVAWFVLRQVGGMSQLLPNTTINIDTNPIQQVINKVNSPFDGLSPRHYAMLVSFEDKAGPDVLGMAYDVKTSKNTLVYLDPISKTLRWRVDAELQSKFLPTADVVYLANKTRLLALDRSTGTTRWETSLSDEITNVCDECLRVVADKMVVLTKDDVLQGFDAKSGKKAWSKQLANVLPRFFVWGDKVVAIDRHENTDGLPAQATVLNANGDIELNFDITCRLKGERSSVYSQPYDAMRLDGASGALYTWYGTFDGCAQKWDLNTGKALWTTTILDAQPPEYDNANFLLRGETLFVGGADQMLALNTTTGKATSLVPKSDDYDKVWPLGEQDGVLVVRALRTRGTPRFELWGIDATTGNKLWDVKFGEGGPMRGEGPDYVVGLIGKDKDDVAWAAQLTPAGVVLLRNTGKPQFQLSIETLNVKDGTSQGQKAIKLNVSSPFYSAPAVLGWRNEVAWLHLDNSYYGVDVSKAEIVGKVP